MTDTKLVWFSIWILYWVLKQKQYRPGWDVTGHDLVSGSWRFVRLNDDPNLILSFVGQCLKFDFVWTYRGSTRDFL